MKFEEECVDDSWEYTCLKFYQFSAIDYVVFTLMLVVSAGVGVIMFSIIFKLKPFFFKKSLKFKNCICICYEIKSVELLRNVYWP